MEFPLVELQVQKYFTSTFVQQMDGKWVTRHYLMNVEHWTKTPT